MDTQEYFLDFVGRCRASKEWMGAACDMLLAVLGRARGIGPGWHDTNKFFVDLPTTAHDAFWVLLGLSLIERQEDAVWLGRSAGRAQYWRLRTLGSGFCHDSKTGAVGFGDNIAIDNFRQGQGLDEIPSRSSVFSLEFRITLLAEEILDSGNPAGELARLINDFDVENGYCFGRIIEQHLETAVVPVKAQKPSDGFVKRGRPKKDKKFLLSKRLISRLGLPDIEKSGRWVPVSRASEIAELGGETLRRYRNDRMASLTEVAGIRIKVDCQGRVSCNSGGRVWYLFATCDPSSVYFGRFWDSDKK